ncbi:hypothetical protein AAG570_005729 [Ranatra chinensis]|uniref:Uncharacterized protein n=1 Tax=Ranatra chinensis TaxID=642074 RepID=A0ABD0YK15_9HEMI
MASKRRNMFYENKNGVVVTTAGSRRPSSLLERSLTMTAQPVSPEEEEDVGDWEPQSPADTEDSCWVETPSFRTPPPAPAQQAGRTSSSETSLSFRTPSSGEGSPTTPEGSLGEEPPRAILAILADVPRAAPPAAQAAPDLAPPTINLARAPSSRRRLVRSLVRISSQTPIELSIDEPKSWCVVRLDTYQGASSMVRRTRLEGLNSVEI